MNKYRALLLTVVVTASTCGLLPFARAGALLSCPANASCPIAADDSYTASAGGPMHVAAPGVLANDAAAPGTVVDVDLSDWSTWNGATVDLHPDGSFTYTPDSIDPQAGDDWFSYEIHDPQGNTADATVYLAVDAQVRDDSYSTPVDTPLVVDSPGLVANDAAIDDSSVESDEISTAGADVTVFGDGSFEYDPPPGFQGNDTFTYTVDDTSGDYEYAAEVHVGVGTPPPPVSSTPRPKTGSTSGPVATPTQSLPLPTTPTVPASPGAAATIPAAGAKPTTKAAKSPPSTKPKAAKTPTTKAGAASGTSTTAPDTAPAKVEGSASAANPGGGSSGGGIALVVVLGALALSGGAAGTWYGRRRKKAKRAARPPGEPTPS